MRDLRHRLPEGWLRFPEGWIRPPEGWVRPLEGWVRPPESWIRPPRSWVRPPRGWVRPPEGWARPPEGWVRPRGECTDGRTDGPTEFPPCVLQDIVPYQVRCPKGNQSSLQLRIDNLTHHLRFQKI